MTETQSPAPQRLNPFWNRAILRLQISDARLIATAPDLLSALLSLVNVVPINGDDDDDPQQAAAWNAARAAIAIAKATGGQL